MGLFALPLGLLLRILHRRWVTSVSWVSSILSASSIPPHPVRLSISCAYFNRQSLPLRRCCHCVWGNGALPPPVLNVDIDVESNPRLSVSMVLCAVRIRALPLYFVLQLIRGNSRIYIIVGDGTMDSSVQIPDPYLATTSFVFQSLRYLIPQRYCKLLTSKTEPLR